MSVCVYSVFVLSFLQVAALRQAHLPSKDSYRLCKKIKKLKKKKRPRSNKRLYSHRQICLRVEGNFFIMVVGVVFKSLAYLEIY
jgi:hypothetical protein